jgi:hypothetical protein
VKRAAPVTRIELGADNRKLVQLVDDAGPEGGGADVSEDGDDDQEQGVDRREPVPPERDDEGPCTVGASSDGMTCCHRSATLRASLTSFTQSVTLLTAGSFLAGRLTIRQPVSSSAGLQPAREPPVSATSLGRPGTAMLAGAGERDLFPPPGRSLRIHPVAYPSG